MATRQDEQAPGCKASQEQLVSDGYKYSDDCPICQRRGVLCEVANHRSRLLHSTDLAAPLATTPVSAGEGKIYVKGLPWKLTEGEVCDFFKRCPDLLRAELPLDENGRASGTAFVFFNSRNGIDAALALDGQYWPNTERWLKIQEATEKSDRKSFSGGPTGEKPEGCDTVFVGNLPWEVDEDAMRNVFSPCGNISSVRFATGEDGSFRGFGHVSFYNADAVDEAIKLAGTTINGRALRVDFALPRNRPAGSPSGRGGGHGRGV